MGVLDAVLCKELACTACCIKFVTIVNEHLCSIKHFNLLLGTTCRKKNVLLRYAIAYREHALEQGCVCIVAQATYLACRTHVYAKHRVGLL